MKYERNIALWYNRADMATWEAGMNWYDDAQSFAKGLNRAFDYPLPNIAAAIAHMSPRVHWRRNKGMTIELLSTGQTRGLKGNINRARLALVHPQPLSTLNGPKVRAFGHNIAGDLTMVTVDTWAQRAAGHNGNLNKTAYADISTAYSNVARRYNVLPAQLQAVVWCAIRNRAH